MRWPVEVGCSGQTQTNEGQKGSDRVNDENGGQGFAGARGQIEVVAGIIDII